MSRGRCPTCGSSLWNGCQCGSCGAKSAAGEETNTEPAVPDPVVIVDHRGTRYLVNLIEVGIKYLIYDTWCEYNDWEDRQTYRSTVARFRIDNLPPHSHVAIEEIDITEEGVIFFVLHELMWEEGTVDHGILLRRRKLWDGGTVPGNLCDIEKQSLGVVAHSTQGVEENASDETLKPITTKEGEEQGKFWMWEWNDGGWNSCRAGSREEALAKGMEIAKWKAGRAVDEATLRESSAEEVDARFLAKFDD